MSVRNAFVSICLSVAILLGAGVPAWAQTDIFIQGSGRLFPIAVPQLCAQRGESAAVREIPEIISRNLTLSGYFEVLDPGGFIETPGRCAGPDEFAYSDWSVIGAEGLVRGTVEFDGARLRVQLFLHDVLRRRVVLAKEYEGPPTQIARIAHRFSNEIVRFFTGSPGVFGTQIAFSSKVGRFKELFVMDMDGSNLRQLTNDRALAVSSSWSPDGKRIIFTSYRNRMPDLFTLALDTRGLAQITRTSSLELGAQYTPQGDGVLVAQSIDGDSRIVVLNLDGTVRQTIVPRSRSIDISPAWSPDGRQIAFCSNRGGGPQIYVTSASGGSPKRISFVTSNYCTSPAWSPLGDKLAFVCRVEGRFQIFTAGVDGSNPVQLTSFGDNEDPDWAPNGKLMVFSSTFGRGFNTGIALMRDDGTNLKRITEGRLADSEPSWSPYME